MRGKKKISQAQNVNLTHGVATLPHCSTSPALPAALSNRRPSRHERGLECLVPLLEIFHSLSNTRETLVKIWTVGGKRPIIDPEYSCIEIPLAYKSVCLVSPLTPCVNLSPLYSQHSRATNLQSWSPRAISLVISIPLSARLFSICFTCFSHPLVFFFPFILHFL